MSAVHVIRSPGELKRVRQRAYLSLLLAALVIVAFSALLVSPLLAQRQLNRDSFDLMRQLDHLRSVEGEAITLQLRRGKELGDALAQVDAMAPATREVESWRSQLLDEAMRAGCKVASCDSIAAAAASAALSASARDLASVTFAIKGAANPAAVLSFTASLTEMRPLLRAGKLNVARRDGSVSEVAFEIEVTCFHRATGA
ncbi:MAG: hypothetical protein U1E76_25870 [Planctomycetota bacterium]